jgi:flagellar hook-basal body complex protein FliE
MIAPPNSLSIQPPAIPNVAASLTAASQAGTNTTAPREVGAMFRDTLRRAVGAVNEQAHSADAAAQTMVAGNGANLHETMIELEKADLSVRLAVRIGQKLVQAYQEVSRMQV